MSIENRNLAAFNLYPLANALKERLPLEGNGDIEKGLEAEVINWITVRPQKEHIRHFGKKTLAFLGGSIIATAYIYGFSNQYEPGVHIEALMLSTTLVLGCFMTLPFAFSFGKDVEPEDNEILKAMKTDEGRRQMSALLALRKEFAEGHFKMIYQNSEGNRRSVSPSLFRRLNSLNLLLPQRGIRRYVCKADGLQHGRFFVSDGRELIQPEVKNNPRTIQAVSPNHTKGECILNHESDDFVAATDILNTKHNKKLIPHFRAIRLGRARIKKLVKADRRIVLENLYEDVAKNVDGLGPSTVKKLFTGHCDSFEKAVVFPDASAPE